ncbi:hypothetical protein DMN57_28690 [Escherichia coli]|nr:hypothetical protein [Escherichia coli]
MRRKHVVKLEITQSGKLAQNAFIESFNRTYRTKYSVLSVQNAG